MLEPVLTRLRTEPGYQLTKNEIEETALEISYVVEGASYKKLVEYLSFVNFLKDDPYRNPDNQTEREVMEIMLADDVEKMLEILTERQSGIIKMRFGIGRAEPMGLEEVGLEFGVTRERIRQIEAKVMANLRHQMPKNSAMREYLED